MVYAKQESAEIDRCAALALRLLGGFEIVVRGRAAPPLRSRQGQSVLALLALAAGRPVGRDTLAATLWPDSSPEQALYNLRRNLTDIRHALGPEAERLQSPTLRTLALDLRDADCDVARLRAYATGDDPLLWEQAAALYRGPFLEDCAEEWVLADRERLRETYLDVLERLASRCPIADQRVAYLRGVIATDPTRESAQRSLMAALAMRGDYAAATQAYRTFRLELHERLGVSPDAETTALHRRLRAEAKGRASASPAENRFVLGWSSGSSAAPEAATPDQAASRHQAASELLGRRRELAEVAVLLGSARLVTLIGAGGMGKTRLAVAAAAAAADDFEDGTAFVDLSAISDGTLVAHAVAAAVGVREEADAPVLKTLAAGVRSRHLLIVLDNCEQVLPACARLAEAVLRAANGVRLLATSRIALGVAGEHLFAVPGLETPPPRRQLGPRELLAFPAIELFVRRATAVSPRFTLDVGNMAPVREICGALDGMPLAIELAAARARTLAPAEIARHLGQRLRLLTGGSRRAPQRQQTLRALIDWSHDLLTPAERSAFARLSVFAGGFNLEQAEAVLADHLDRRAAASGGAAAAATPVSGIEQWEVLDVLTSLAERSLIVAGDETAGDEPTAPEPPRYRILETLREYARERLESTPEQARVVRGRHADHFLAVAQEANLFKPGPQQAVWLDRLDREVDNLRAAIDWTRTDDGEAAAQAGLKFAYCLGGFWRVRMYATEGRARIAAALDRAADLPPSAERASVLMSAGNMAYVQADFGAAQAYFERAFTESEAAGSPRTAAAALGSMGNVMQDRGDRRAARGYFERAHAVFVAIDSRQQVATVLACLGSLALADGDSGEAVGYLERAIAASREVGDAHLTVVSLTNFARAHAEGTGDISSARRAIEEALPVARDCGAVEGLIMTLRVGAQVARLGQDLDTAERRVRECAELLQGSGNRGEIANLVGEAANLLAARGRLVEAAELWACTRAEYTAMSVPSDDMEGYREGTSAAEALGIGEAFGLAAEAGARVSGETMLARLLAGGVDLHAAGSVMV